MRICGSKREAVAGDWRSLHNEELQNLYYSPNITRVMKSRRMGWVMHVARMVDVRNACKILVAKLKRKKPLERARRRLRIILE
jgi:hypothetical protein